MSKILNDGRISSFLKNSPAVRSFGVRKVIVKALLEGQTAKWPMGEHEFHAHEFFAVHPDSVQEVDPDKRVAVLVEQYLLKRRTAIIGKEVFVTARTYEDGSNGALISVSLCDSRGWRQLVPQGGSNDVLLLG